MNKKEEMLSFLTNEFFYPILQSPHASCSLKSDLKDIFRPLQHYSAEGIMLHLWNTLLDNTNKTILFHRLADEGFASYADALNTFEKEFTYHWLKS